MSKTLFYIVLAVITVAAPFAFPDFQTQLATLWLMIIVAQSWDMTGGPMGYNSLGNIFFYGTGIYVAAVVKIGLVYPVGEYAGASGGGIYTFTPDEYFLGVALSIPAAHIPADTHL